MALAPWFCAAVFSFYLAALGIGLYYWRDANDREKCWVAVLISGLLIGSSLVSLVLFALATGCLEKED